MNEKLSFDFEEDEKFVEYTEKMEFNENKLTNQVKDMGFESYNSILNLGGLFALILLYFVQIVIARVGALVVWLFV